MFKSPLVAGGLLLMAIAFSLMVQEDAHALFRELLGEDPDVSQADLNYVPSNIQFPYSKDNSIFISGPTYADKLAMKMGYKDWNDYVAKRVPNKMGEEEYVGAPAEFGPRHSADVIFKDVITPPQDLPEEDIQDTHTVVNYIKNPIHRTGPYIIDRDYVCIPNKEKNITCDDEETPPKDPPAAVPEPQGLWLLGIGILALIMLKIHRARTYHARKIENKNP